MSTLKIVNIADMKLSNNTDEVLITYSLGSCVAVVIYDPFLKCGGMIHIMLPDSTIERDPLRVIPYKYVDTGVPLLYKGIFNFGSKRNQLITKVIGGSEIMDTNKFFNIGQRNYLAVRKMLWRNNVVIHGEDVGGSKSRTVRLFLDTGIVVVSNAHEEYKV